MVKSVVGNSVVELLRGYRESEAAEPWMLATVVTKYRSSYRKPGAMMLLSPLGQSFGLISGGCLESNIRLQARKAQEQGAPRLVLYDSMDEDNVAAELGLGCNGRVEVLVQELDGFGRQVLLELLQRLEAGESCYLGQCYESSEADDLRQLALFNEQLQPVNGNTSKSTWCLDAVDHQLVQRGPQRWSINRHRPAVRFWVFGGGIDARPMVAMAHQLGWQVTLVDHRVTHARQEDFPDAANIIRDHPHSWEKPIDADAVVLMSHNLQQDAAWLSQVQSSASVRYIGLLGPHDRKQTVMEIAGVEAHSELNAKLHGPMGFDIGGDLPESVALSVLAQCHQALFK